MRLELNTSDVRDLPADQRDGDRLPSTSEAVTRSSLKSYPRSRCSLSDNSGTVIVCADVDVIQDDADNVCARRGHMPVRTGRIREGGAPP